MPLPDIQLSFQPKLLNSGISHFEVIDSTNAFLLNSDEYTHGSVVLADFQTAGRGRLQRKWESGRADSLLFSVVLTKGLKKFPTVAFSFSVAMAVYDAIQAKLPVLKPALKWPNDVLVNGKKICGILVESRSGDSGLSKVVIGIGVNVSQDAEFFCNDLLKNGSSLELESGMEIDRLGFFQTLLYHLDSQLASAKNKSNQDIIRSWKTRCSYLGTEVEINSHNEKIRGWFVDVATDGALILNIENQRQKFYAGDVSLRQVAD